MRAQMIQRKTKQQQKKTIEGGWGGATGSGAEPEEQEAPRQVQRPTHRSQMFFPGWNQSAEGREAIISAARGPPADCSSVHKERS